MKTQVRNKVTAASVGLVLLTGTAGWLAWSMHQPAKPQPKMVYVASGYGGFVPAPMPAVKDPAGSLRPEAKLRPIKPADRVQPLREAYNAGQYSAVEAGALSLVSRARTSRSREVQEQGAEAGSLLAYAAARRHDLRLAQVRFAAAQAEAARLPDKGKQADLPGQMSPTLEEDAAFQHAVCTNALGDPNGAEKEYVAWMQRYPESPLRNAVVLRLQKLHDGNLTAAEEAVRRQASVIAQVRQTGREREASLCGPECLAELLRRRGDTVSVHALANAMHTSDRGTTLDALSAAAQRHGFAARGLALTSRGLAEQTLPVIALIAPGHYVLVDKVTAAGVTLWDPDAQGQGHGAARAVPSAQWQQQWRGVTLALGRVQTAHS
ncbi:MAG: cysteine peptidase family C39 domain-containing protein [Janthinobacterium lividum]